MNIHHVPAATMEGITSFLLLTILAYLVVRITGLLAGEGPAHEISPIWTCRVFFINHMILDLVETLRPLSLEEFSDR